MSLRGHRIGKTNPIHGLASQASRDSAGLQVTAARDSLEREADHAASVVMTGADNHPAWSLSRMSMDVPLQRKCSCGGSGACDECKEKAKVQRQAAGPASPGKAPAIVHEVLRSPGMPLDAGTRAFMEPRFRHNFGDVRIFTDDRAALSAEAVSAHAYTVANNIVFNKGRYSPDSDAGRRLIAHELAHVVQQSRASREEPRTQPERGRTGS